MTDNTAAADGAAGRFALLQRDRWFASCPEPMQRALCELAQPVHLADGQALFGRGSDTDGLCCLIEGTLRFGRRNARGRFALLAVLDARQWFGELTMIDGLPRTHDAVAEGEALVLLMPAQALQAWLTQHPACWRDLARLTCAKFRASLRAMEDLARLPVEQLVVRRLLLAADGYGNGDGEPQRRLKLSQERLAQMLGLSRQSVNRALRTMESRGWLALHYGGIELLDLAALRVADGAA